MFVVKYLQCALFWQVMRHARGDTASLLTIQNLDLAHPKDVGSGHTQIIVDLQNRIEQHQPRNKDEYLNHLSITMVNHLCNPSDAKCKSYLEKKTANLECGPKGDAKDGFEHVSLNVFPKDFDPYVLESFEVLFHSVAITDLKTKPTEIVKLMDLYFQDLKRNENILNEDHRQIGLVAYSVAMESTKQWFEILNDQNNAFYQFLLLTYTDSMNGRKLQDLTSVIDFVGLIEADIIGATEGAILSLFNPATDPILQSALAQASIASSKQVIDSITPDVPDLSLPELPNNCLLFPNSPLCNPNTNEDFDDNECIFPNSPLCDSTATNNSVVNQVIENNNGTFPGCGIFPNSPLC